MIVQQYEDQYTKIPFCLMETQERKNHLRKLFEMYRRPDLSWVPEFIEDLHDYPNSIQKLAQKNNIVFQRNKQSRPFQAKYGNVNDVYIVYINDLAIKNIKEGTNLDFLSEQLIDVLTHEETHRQQNQLKSNEQPYYSKEKNTKYLSQYCEIDAFARQVARNIEYEYGFDPDLSDIKNLKLTTLSRQIIDDYYNIGGKVLNKFLREIYNWFHEPADKSSMEYKQWLWDHQ